MVKQGDYIICILASVIILFFAFIPVIDFYHKLSQDDMRAQTLTSLSLIVICLSVNFIVIYFFNRAMDGTGLLKRWVKSIGITAAGCAFVYWVYGIFSFLAHS